MPVVGSCEESLNEMHLAGRDELCWQMNQAGQERARKGRPCTTPYLWPIHSQIEAK
jgi:hypothetical protein